jgi:ABC-type nitrate/sulfonate/bicarbonate transport system substrate-binding protein
LKGVEIGISQATVIEYITYRLLADAGLAASDIKTTNVIKIADRMQLLGTGQIKAATLPEPLATLAEQQGALRVVADKTNPDHSNSVISFSAQTIKDKPQTVRKFLAAYEKAVADVNRAFGTRYLHADMMDRVLFAEARGYYGIPGVDIFGVQMLAPTLLQAASEEIKRKFLPPIARGAAAAGG